ncbi:cyclin-dependent kinase inhibitor 6-like [Salvia miltiorrhiza]|uniref:cyclin-dependent kinase inhibitor 6-like n=1 Tax=Salvia miltiorrhiza TaxID=226208 RepID=UPI0025AD22EC|nr:cyclin-dependent kinase inhibitor 6-like [Salvia miltiorrhiza]
MEKAAAAGERKRKVYAGESEFSASSIQLKARRLDDATAENSASPANSGGLSCETVGADDGLASCCSSDGSSELTKETSKLLDLEDNETTVEFLTTSADDSLDCRERSETTPSREALGESGELESTARPREPDPRRLSAGVKMPSEAQLEEFFAAAEKKLQQKFIDKYNFDIVKDQPLEGRYDWVHVQLRPE